MRSNPIIVAVDFPTEREARNLVAQLDPELCALKVGKELFTAAGPGLVRAWVRAGYDLFLDLKFHDIPNTVAAACRVAADMGVAMVDVHAAGGAAMLTAAREALECSGSGTERPRLVAITVLTSLLSADLERMGWNQPLAEVVQRLAGLAHSCGLDGVVCSAQEAAGLRQNWPAPFLLVTPGIRLGQPALKDDQARVMNPRQALAAGASHLVIGRPITRSPAPLATLHQIQSLLSHGSSS